MPSTVRHITVDCAAPHEPYGLAEFWSKVLDYPLHPDDEPGDDEVLLDMPDGQPGLLFIRVPEPKTVKNRIHLDLEPDQPRDQEVERVAELGGTVVDDRRKPNGRGWVVFADPAGNEFCVELGTAEREAAAREEAEREAAGSE
ncbi:hypothetical protein CLV30_104297 [Haloactinopolyspora alba]|uniref:Glyoxalase-like domain-containing protein n=1 Tax=Haloactinopolyspora alba TaxID=648780 RepID=A0A2P8E7K0_9ACTN|nr:VOC family protein [Haloactinopolyspora alba]PSL05427.1 hypothetical protein CLV30_104297 [Haloactinopolyspora alba]